MFSFSLKDDPSKLAPLNFRSGFFLDSEAEAGAYLDKSVSDLEPSYAVMRVAIASTPKAIVKEIATQPKPESFLKRVFGLFAGGRDSALEVATQSVRPELNNNPDITRTNAAYQVVDFKIPIKRDDDGLLVLDSDRQVMVEKIKDDDDFDKALFNVMAFANPDLTEAYNQRKLPRIPEGDQAFMSMLSGVDFKTANEERIIDFAYIAPVEKFLNSNKIGFNALDPVSRNSVDLNNLPGSISPLVLPDKYCRSPADLQEQYKFKEITTPLTLIKPSFATAAGYEMSEKQRYALACLNLMENAKEYFKEQGFKFDFTIKKFDAKGLVFSTQVEGPSGFIEQTIKFGPEHEVTDAAGRHQHSVTDIKVENQQTRSKSDMLYDLYRYRSNDDQDFFGTVQEVYNDSVFSQRFKSLASEQDDAPKLVSGPT